MFIHGGVPDVEKFIVAELAKFLPLEVVERTPPAPDPEETDPTNGARDGTD